MNTTTIPTRVDLYAEPVLLHPTGYHNLPGEMRDAALRKVFELVAKGWEVVVWWNKTSEFAEWFAEQSGLEKLRRPTSGSGRVRIETGVLAGFPAAVFVDPEEFMRWPG